MINQKGYNLGTYQPCFYTANVAHYLKTMAKQKDKAKNKENYKQRKGPPKSNVKQNDQARNAREEITRRLGQKKLTKDQKQQFHDHVTGQGYTYQELIEEGYWLFHKD